jgi:hypothetical protein
VAEHCTVVVPTEKLLPDAGAQVTAIVPLTESVAEGKGENGTATPLEVGATTETLPGSISVGGVVSRTVTVKLLVPV